MKILLKMRPLFLGIPVILTACGGGGGSSGATEEQYSISLRSDKASLPVNLYGYAAGQGAYAPYTTSMYVSAKRGGEAIPGGENIFGCNIASGLDSGSLYYLDGDKAHEDDKGNPLAYRSITLGANSGGASFHLHAKDKAGTVVVVCSVTDPRDGKIYTSSANVVVGSASTNTPGDITLLSTGTLGTSGNVSGLDTRIAMQAQLWNDNNQPVSAGTSANVQVSIRGGSAAPGARLMIEGKTATSMSLRSNGGVAQFSLASGASEGAVLLELTSDRADNDVTNGIQEPITRLVAVPVAKAIATTPLALDATQLESLTISNAQPFYAALTASGGVPAYTFEAVAGLPTGLTLSSSGVLQGTPWVAKPGSYTVTVRVTDSIGATVTQQMKLTITGELPATPVAFDILGCSGGINTACPLPSGVVGSGYAYAFSASGGGTINWSYQGLPGWLDASATGTTGLIAAKGALTCESVGMAKFFVTASNATNSVTRQVSITVLDDPSCHETPATTP